MTISSRRARRTTRLGKRAALSLPVALLALTIMAPAYADGDAGANDAAVANEAQADKPEPKPEPEVKPEEPKPAPEVKPEEPKPAPEQKPEEPKPAAEPKADPKEAAPAGDGAEDSAQQVKSAPAETEKADKGDKDVVEEDKDAKDDVVEAAAPAPNKKVVVCKYVGTPPGTPHHIIVVSKSAIKDWDGETFPWTFVDAQDSVAIRYAVGNEQPGNEQLVNCPGFDPGDPDPDPIVVDAPDLDVIDPCGPNNAEYEALAATDEFGVTVNDDGSVTLTAKTGFVFDGDEPTFTYPAPVDTNVACPDDDSKKIVVCKYVGTPPGVPHHIIVVSENAALAQGWDGKFPGIFADAQDSIAIRYAVGNEQPGNEELVNCPLEEIDPPTLEPVDPCGPDNIAFPEIFDTDEYTVGVTGDGDVTLSALPGFEFPGGESSLTFLLPDDSNEPCPVERQLVACVYADDAAGDEIELALAPLGEVVLVDEVDAFNAGFTGVLPYEYMSGSDIVELRQYLEPGQTLADFDAEELCGEVGGIVCDATDPDAVDENGDPCVPDETDVCDEVGATADTADDCGEVGGIVEDSPSPAAAPVADVLPNTGGPLALLAPLGALMVLVGAGLVMVRRPHSA